MRRGKGKGRQFLHSVCVSYVVDETAVMELVGTGIMHDTFLSLLATSLPLPHTHSHLPSPLVPCCCSSSSILLLPLHRYAVCKDLSALLPVVHYTPTVAGETCGAVQRGPSTWDAVERVPRIQDHHPGTYTQKMRTGFCKFMLPTVTSVTM